MTELALIAMWIFAYCFYDACDKHQFEAAATQLMGIAFSFCLLIWSVRTA